MAVDVERCIERLKIGERLPEGHIAEICMQLRDLLTEESNVQAVPVPCAIVGDIHGQFYDLLELFRVAGQPPYTNYVFLGDYVDRGYYSVETISLLACLKLRYPKRIWLLRGNHESRQITQVYGFYDEVMRKYGSSRVWKDFTDMFDALCLAAVVDGRYLCVHAGLSPHLTTIDQMRVLDRFGEVPAEGPMSDLLWSDPDQRNDGFNRSQRGAGFHFGSDVVSKFLKKNGLTKMMRGHQLCMEGYQVLFDDELSTIWSAPNYCYRCGNVACVLEIDEAGALFYNTFEAAPDAERKRPTLERNISEYFV